MWNKILGFMDRFCSFIQGQIFLLVVKPITAFTLFSPLPGEKAFHQWCAWGNEAGRLCHTNATGLLCPAQKLGSLQKSSTARSKPTTGRCLP